MGVLHTFRGLFFRRSFQCGSLTSQASFFPPYYFSIIAATKVIFAVTGNFFSQLLGIYNYNRFTDCLPKRQKGRGHSFEESLFSLDKLLGGCTHLTQALPCYSLVAT